MTQETYTGGCGCGAVRYHAVGRPVAQLHCQCSHCQRRSGTGHASYLVFAGPEAVTLTGELRVWSLKGDSGTDKHHAFCPVCGIPIHVTSAANPGITAIHPGSLDAPERFAPGFVTYGTRGLGWDRMDPGLMVFDKGPTG